MIGLSRLKRAIGDAPTSGMQTGDPKVRLKLCDAQRLEVEFNAIIAERDAALAQNAELVAQVEIVRSGLIDARKWVDERNNVCDKAKDFCDTLTDIIESTPTQCLRDIQAEAVTECQLIVARATTTYRENPGMGFSSTIEDKTAKQLKQELSKDLELYAERVKRGEA